MQGPSSQVIIYKSEVMASGYKPTSNSVIDKAHIRRIVYLEEALKKQFLSIESAANLVHLYYTHEGEKLEPIPGSSTRSFQRELATAKSKIVVELNKSDLYDAEEDNSQVFYFYVNISFNGLAYFSLV